MVIFDSTFFSVSQGWLTGWKVKDKTTGAISIPNSTMKSQVGLVWMQVRRTKKHKSLDSAQSEDMLFFSFAKAVRNPSCSDGKIWAQLEPDALADLLISEANKTVHDPFHKPDWW